MKKIIIHTLMLVGLISVSSCTRDYEDINTNVYGVTEEQLEQGGVISYGNSFLKMQQFVIRIGAPSETTRPGNDLAVSDIMSSGAYIGYFGMNNNWNFNTEASWNFTDGRMKYANEVLYSNLFTEWKSIKNAIGNTDNLQQKRAYALANIIKITAWLRATDAFGPIVYTRAGNGELTPSLDKQEDIYRIMLAELDECITTLGNGTTVLSDYDVIYSGSIPKWKKFASSLMLRMAVRSHFKDAALANTYIAKALAHGVMTDASDEAKIGSTPIQPLKNSIIATIDYNETRMGLTIWSYFKGYNDPRIDVLFKKGTYNNTEDYYGVAPTSNLPKLTAANTAMYASIPNVNDSSPLYWMRTSEVLFLKAEAALYNLGGLSSSQAQGFYEDGIRMSFQEMGVAMPSNYLTSTDTPAILSRYWYDSAYNYDLSTNNVSPSWNDGAGTDEVHLQKIITQKYLAMYPNAFEAWTEYRRTGYPLVMKYQDTNAPARIGSSTSWVPERFKYSGADYITNPKIKSEVPTLLGGADTGATQLWWVRPNRPQQR
ncbi:SusD/RagB family nutrient-binding outer membrane lipoprotein [Capnocytophaga sp. HP1101]